MTAPERIWLDGDADVIEGIFPRCFGTPKPCSEPALEYIRADLARPTLSDALALPEVKALVEALEHCLGTITCGMDGVWDHTVSPQNLARAAIAAVRGKE